MDSPTRFPSPRALWLSLAGMALLAVLLGAVATGPYGPGVAGDGIAYLSVAENLRHGLGFLKHNGLPLVEWPPLTPLLLAAGAALTGADVLQVGRWLNLLSLGGIVFLGGALVYASLPERRLWALVAGLVLLTSTSWLRVAANISSDPLFMVLVLGFLLASWRYLKRPGPGILLAMGLLAGLAAVQRYAGIALGATGALLILWTWRRSGRCGAPRRLAGELVLFGLLAAGPLLAWVLGHNLPATGTLSGVRPLERVQPLENLLDTYTKMMSWFLPYALTDRAPSILFVGFGLGFLLGFNGIKAWRRFGRRWLGAAHLPQLVFASLYLGLLVVSVLTQDVRFRISDRYQAVLLPSVLVLLFTTLEELVLKGLPEARLRLVCGVLTLLFGLWLVYPAYGTAKYVLQARELGEYTYNQYTTRQQQEADITAFLQAYPFEENAVLYANYTPAGWLATRRTTLNAPANDYPLHPEREHLLANFSGWPAQEPAYLLWFLPNEFDSYYPPEMLAEVARLEQIFKAKDGEVYRVYPK